MRLPRRPALLAAALAVLLALGLAWVLWPEASTRPSGSRLAEQALAAAPAASQAALAATPWDLLRQATQTADARPAEAAHSAEPVWQALQEAEAQWCAGVARGADLQALAVAMQQEGERAMALLRAEWLRRLREGSEQDRALAEWLDTRPGGPALLREQALRGSDAFVTALALSRCGDDVDCHIQLVAHWRRLEPGNMIAQLYGEGAHHAPESLLQKMAAANLSRSYQGEVMRRLSALPMPESQGPIQAAALAEWIGRGAAWPLPSFQALTKGCRGAQAERAALCLAAADRLWTLSEEGLIEPLIAARVGSMVAPQDPGWARRLQRVKAAQALLEKQALPFADLADRQMRCQSLSPAEQARFADWLRPEWPRLQAQLPPPSP